MKSIRDKISAKLKLSLGSLGLFLIKDAKRKGLNMGFLLGLLSAYATSFFLRRTQFYRKYDRYGIISDSSIDLYIILLFYAKFCYYGKRMRIKPYSFPTQVVVSVVSFLLPVIFHKYYEISLETICVLTYSDIAFLALLLVLRSPYSDYGFFTAIMGIIADINRGLTSSKHPLFSWLVYGFCILLILFKLWLDDTFLKEQEEHDPSLEFDQSQNPVSKILPFNPLTPISAFYMVVLFQVWNIFARFGTKDLPLEYAFKSVPEIQDFAFYLNMVMSGLMKALPYGIGYILWLICFLKALPICNCERLQRLAERVFFAGISEDDNHSGTRVIYSSIFGLLFSILYGPSTY